MLGFKIALTGAFVAAISAMAIKAIGKMPSLAAVGLLLLVPFFGGLGAAVVGVLVSIWQD